MGGCTQRVLNSMAVFHGKKVLVGTGRAISTVTSMAVSRLRSRKVLVGTGRAIPIVFGI